jgi:hypothetical protein
MTSQPFASELVSDAELERLIDALCKRPGMFVAEPSLSSVCAYIQGFDDSRWGGALVGFHQWLVVKHKGGNNVHWSGLVQSSLDVRTPENEAIAAFGELLMDFIKYRRSHGLTKIFHEYAKWLLRQGWYRGPLRSGPTSLSPRSRAKPRDRG